MSNYERSTEEGPGAIAALPATIGLTHQAPTIGAHAPGRRIPMAYNLGLGTNGEGAATPAVTQPGNGWVLPMGIGLALGGLLALMMIGSK